MTRARRSPSISCTSQNSGESEFLIAVMFRRPVGFLLYLFWVATESLSGLLYGVLFVFAAGLLIWSGVAIIGSQGKR